MEKNCERFKSATYLDKTPSTLKRVSQPTTPASIMLLNRITEKKGFFNMNKLLIQKREEISETRVAKMVFPATTNHYDTLFGGIALQWMDEVAYIAATRFARKTMVTISTEQVDFKQPIPSGILVELIARVVHVGRTSLKVEVSIFLERLDSDKRTKAVTGHFNFVAVDNNKKPTPIFDEENNI